MCTKQIKAIQINPYPSHSIPLQPLPITHHPSPTLTHHTQSLSNPYPPHSIPLQPLPTTLHPSPTLTYHTPSLSNPYPSQPIPYQLQAQRYCKRNTLHLHAMLPAPSCHPTREVSDALPPMGKGEGGEGKTRPRKESNVLQQCFFHYNSSTYL